MDTNEPLVDIEDQYEDITQQLIDNLEESPEYADQVHTVEMAVLGLYQMLELEASKGGQLLRETVKNEYREKRSKERKEIKRVEYRSRRWARINVQALLFGLKRRYARLKRIEQAEDKAKALMELG